MVNSINDAPVLTDEKATLVDGLEDVPYLIKETDLLQGYSDVDGDTLVVNQLTSSNVELTNNGDGTWTLIPAVNFNGQVNLNYIVTDGNGSNLEGSQSFSRH